MRTSTISPSSLKAYDSNAYNYIEFLPARSKKKKKKNFASSGIFPFFIISTVIKSLDEKRDVFLSLSPRLRNHPSRVVRCWFQISERVNATRALSSLAHKSASCTRVSSMHRVGVYVCVHRANLSFVLSCPVAKESISKLRKSPRVSRVTMRKENGTRENRIASPRGSSLQPMAKRPNFAFERIPFRSARSRSVWERRRANSQNRRRECIKTTIS